MFKQKRLQEALTSYNNAIELASDNKSIELDQNFSYAHYQRGNILYDLKRKDEALVSYNKSIDLDPNFALARFTRGIVLDDLNRTLLASN